MSIQDSSAEITSNELPQSMGNPANIALANFGVITLEQVSKMTEKELLALHGVGPKAVRILIEELAKVGLALSSKKS